MSDLQLSKTMWTSLAVLAILAVCALGSRTRDAKQKRNSKDYLVASGLREESPHALFAYGTLRPDYKLNGGDRWGATEGCTWEAAEVRGYSLYQNRNAFYPAAVEAKNGIVKGTLISFPGDDAHFKQFLDICNHIEGFDPDEPDEGLYRRAVVNAETESGHKVKAYIYHQDIPAQALQNEFIHFVDGDWAISKSWPSREADGEETDSEVMSDEWSVDMGDTSDTDSEASNDTIFQSDEIEEEETTQIDKEESPETPGSGNLSIEIDIDKDDFKALKRSEKWQKVEVIETKLVKPLTASIATMWEDIRAENHTLNEESRKIKSFQKDYDKKREAHLKRIAEVKKEYSKLKGMRHKVNRLKKLANY